MYKRGQLTLFIILGIIIFAIVFFFLFIGSDKGFKKEILSPIAKTTELRKAQEFIDGCLETLAKEAIDNVYSYGGYAELNNIPKTVNSKNCLVYKNINFYSSYAPTQDFVESQIRIYIREKLDGCLNFKDFKYGIIYNLSGLDVSLPDEVASGRKTIEVILNYYLRIEDNKPELKSSRFTMPSNLVKIIKITSLFIAGNEASSLNACNGFLPCSQINGNSYCNNQGSYCNSNCEGIQINCVDSINREYNLIDYKNDKVFSFVICKTEETNQNNGLRIPGTVSLPFGGT